LDRFEAADHTGNIRISQARGLLDEGLTGLYVEENGKLAGLAWIQRGGSYRFAGTTAFRLADRHCVVRGLLVDPVFRGRGIGKRLNAARLALMPSGCVPVLFVVPENRFAIRNWVKLGFCHALNVRRTRWLRGRWSFAIRMVDGGCEAREIASSISDGHVL